jgi:hypothetical protein
MRKREGNEIEVEEGAREVSTTPESARRSVVTCGRRRAIPSDWWRLEREDEREMEEECWGIL